jgi:hypothetical protein
MNLRIQIPEHLNSILIARAAESGKDVESYVFDTICEQLEVPNTVASAASDFDSWLIEVRKLVPILVTNVDDSRDSIYVGRGE